MARRVYRRRNPSILGEDLWRILFGAAGVGVTAFVNDKLLNPFVSKAIPGNTANSTTGKLADAGTTAASAWVLKKVVGMVNPRAAMDAFHGGMILFGGKLLSVPVPNFAISAKYPEVKFPWSAQAMAPAADPKSLPAAPGTGLPTAATAAPSGIGF